jgi:hypothetical protein
MISAEMKYDKAISKPNISSVDITVTKYQNQYKSARIK